MGIRCLLGHDFGETEVEREREEDGDEMVATIREVETCRRCGTERVISENKEVTSIRTAEEVGLGGGNRADDAVADDAVESATTSAEVDESDAESGSAPNTDEGMADDDGTATSNETTAEDAASDDAPSDADSTVSDGAPADVGAGAAASGTDEAIASEGIDDPESDDGVILPEADEQRGHGEWPDAERDGESATPPDATGEVESGVGTDSGTNTGEDGESSSDRDVESAAGDGELDADSDHGESTEGTGDGVSTATEEPAVADDEREDVEIIGSDDGDDSEVDARDAPIESGTAEDEAGVTGAEESTDLAPDESAAKGAVGDRTDRKRIEQTGADDETTAWPDHGGEDEGFDAEVGGTEDVSFSGNGLTPDVDAEAPDSDAQYVETDTDRADTSTVEESASRNDVATGIAREGSASIDLSDVSDDAKFYCPNCGLTRSAGESSMRAGDICPECRKGYIAEIEE